MQSYIISEIFLFMHLFVIMLLIYSNIVLLILHCCIYSCTQFLSIYIYVLFMHLFDILFLNLILYYCIYGNTPFLYIFFIYAFICFVLRHSTLTLQKCSGSMGWSYLDEILLCVKYLWS